MRVRGRSLAAALVLMAVWVAGCGATHPNGAAGGTATPFPASTPFPGSSPAPPGVTAEIAKLVAHLPPGSTSIAARNLQTGAQFTHGSSGGHPTASIFKVNIIEALMLKHQESGQPLSESESHSANNMIVTSDNDSAEHLYREVGGAHGIKAANQALGLTCTQPDQESWGLTETCAADQVQLLYQLVNPSSPLNQASREYILKLVQNVSPSQRWGVPAVADPGTTFAVKNGWLDLEEGRDWVINSLGIVTYQGHTLLLATLTQNNHSMEAGVSLNEQLSKLAAESVTVQ